MGPQHTVPSWKLVCNILDMVSSGNENDSYVQIQVFDFRTPVLLIIWEIRVPMPQPAALEKGRQLLCLVLGVLGLQISQLCTFTTRPHTVDSLGFPLDVQCHPGSCPGFWDRQTLFVRAIASFYRTCVQWSEQMQFVFPGDLFQTFLAIDTPIF